MDPLSIIAGVLGITSVAAQSSKALFELIDGVRSAPEEITNISRDVHAFYSILYSLEVSLKDSKISTVIAEDGSLTSLLGNLDKPLANCSNVLGQLMLKIRSFVKPLDGERWRMTSNGFQWYFGRREILELTQRLEACKATLDTGLTAIGTLCSVKLMVAGDSGSDKPTRRASADTDAGFALRRYAEEKDTISQYANSMAPPSPPLEAFETSMQLNSSLSTTLQGPESGASASVENKLERLHRAENQRNAMLAAASQGDGLLLEVAIEEGAQVNTKGADGNAAMHVAAMNGNIDIVSILIENNADLNIKTTPRGDRLQRKFEGARTPLHWAVVNGHKDIVELLLEKGADVNAPNTTHRTPLQEAFMHDQQSIVKLLLAKGASVDTADDELWTPLHQASAGNSPLINELLDMGADIEALTGESTIWSSKGHCLATPLYLAAENGREAACKTLLAHGANPRCAAVGGFPIHIACWKGFPAVVRILLDADVDIEERDPAHEETPLIKAASTGQLLVLKLLVEKGADMDARNLFGRNALDHARLHRESGNEEAVRFLEQMYTKRDADRVEKRRVEERKQEERKQEERKQEERRRKERRSEGGGQYAQIIGKPVYVQIEDRRDAERKYEAGTKVKDHSDSD